MAGTRSPKVDPKTMCRGKWSACRDPLQPAYHRAIAANVMALGRSPADIAWLTSSATSEFDPKLIRGYVVALRPRLAAA